MNQNPAGGSMVDPGSTITISVSGAASVPNVVGLSGQSAQASLQSAGFKVNVQTVAANTAPGNVWQQNPNANATVAPGTTVTILVQPQASAPPTPTDSGSASAPASGPPNGGF